MESTRQEVPWTWCGEWITPEVVPEWAVAMVYKITRMWWDDMKGHQVQVYIGKKMLTSTRRKKIGVRAKKASGTRKTYETTVKQSNWPEYWGSCKELIEDQKQYPEQFTRQVLEWCYSKKNATYLELKYQFQYNVLENRTYNNNINGSLYRYDTDRHLYNEHKEKMRSTPRKPRTKKNIQ